MVILSPLARDPKFVAEFESKKTIVTDLISHAPRWLERRLIRMMSENHLRRSPTNSMHLVHAKLGLQSNGFRTRLLKPVIGVLSRLPLGWWEALDSYLIPDRYYVELFHQYPPGLVVVATAGLIFSEVPLLKRARECGVPTMAVDLSWDNLTVKMHPVRRVNRLAVWNENMKQELVELHGFQGGEI